MKLDKLLEDRYSVRNFSDKEVPEEDILKILEAGRLAPTATNAQPQRIIVIQSPKTLEKIRSLTKMTYNAPVILMICYDESKSWKGTAFGDDHDAGQTDASIVATIMMLKAQELGLGTLWARGFNAAEIEKAFELPSNWKIALLLDLGYPADNSKPSPRHTDRLPISETTTFI